MSVALKELGERIACHANESVSDSLVPGLTLLRSDHVSQMPVQTVYTPMVCLIAQGRKRVMLSGLSFNFDAAHYLISSVHLPVTGAVCQASRTRPYLALSLALDERTLTEMSAELPTVSEPDTVPLGLAVTATSPELIAAFVRLLRLLDKPAEIAPLAPLIVREIHYRLLAADRTAMLRRITLGQGRTGQVMRAVNWIRRNYALPFHMDKLAEVSNMSSPSLHRHFKAVTSMSPLQYQKQLRLQEARQMLLAQKGDAATVGFSVGYGSPSQFSREYGRLYGAPPRRDASRQHPRKR